MLDADRNKLQDFIVENTDADLTKLALQKNPFPEIPWASILNQIAARKKAENKLPTWFSHADVVYPRKISVEQTSSEMTAQYKASLVGGKSLIDLTGGFGVDAYFFSKHIDHVTHCEIDAELSQIVSTNAALLSVDNINFITGDSTGILQNSEAKFDWIYVDPSRRNDSKGKVFMLADCLPNVPKLLDLYFSHSDNILIKTAPLLDLSAGLLELQHVASIHIVAVENEVKELLWVLRKNAIGSVKITAVNLQKTHRHVFSSAFGKASFVHFSLPKKYLYEPNAAIMKSGAFDDVSSQFKIDKLHPNTHLYTSDFKLEDFPGRTFEVLQIIGYNKANMKSFERTKINITTRNFPETVAAIRKKWKIADGGDRYCFFTTDMNENKIALLCTKL